MKLRIGKELLAMMAQARKRWNLSYGEIAERTARWGRKYRIDLSEVADPGSYGGTVITVAEGYSQTEYRKLLLLRLTAELAKPDPEPPVFRERPGVDYLVE